MKFKFIGKKTLIIDTLTPLKIYKILQFEHYNRYICVYVIDDKHKLLCIPYSNMESFNENWRYID